MIHGDGKGVGFAHRGKAGVTAHATRMRTKTERARCARLVKRKKR